MFRILIFIAAVVGLAAGITALTQMPGQTVIEIANIRFSASTALIIGVTIAFIMLLIAATLLISRLFRMPKAWSRRNNEKKRKKGMLALTRGLESVVAGDAADAQRHARTASKNLPQEEGLTRLLTAQAAQLAGDEVTAEEAFAAMLEAPETEFLGLRGLYVQSMKAGDRKEAREYAERAFKLRPGAEWAYQSVYALHVDRGAWGDARDALLKALQHGHEGGEVARRREAALLTAMAYASHASKDDDTARREALEALKKAPSFAPAAVLAARLEADAGRRSKAAKILDAAWKEAPHPAIAKTMTALFSNESLERRTGRLRKLAETNPSANESRLLIAEQENALGHYEAARDELEPLLTRAPRARTFSAMANAVRGLYGAEAAQVWLDRAAAAPLDPVPGADGDFHFTTDGWQRLIREFGDYGRLAPPPLEEVQTSLSTEEVRLMLAAPVPAATTPTEFEAKAAPEAPVTDSEVSDQIVDEPASPDTLDAVLADVDVDGDAEPDTVADDTQIADAPGSSDDTAITANHDNAPADKSAEAALEDSGESKEGSEEDAKQAPSSSS